MDASSFPLDACDVLVVGAGIVGLAHAAEAAERGLSVVVVERDTRAIGASIRNFGHCCITAQSGDLLELALVARDRWLHFASLAGFFAVESGALVVARGTTELAIVEQFSRSRAVGQVVLLSVSEIEAELGRSETDQLSVAVSVNSEVESPILGGAFLRDDLRIDPREAVASLAAWLQAQPNVEFRWNTSYLGRDGSAATFGVAVALTSRGPISARRTIVSAGHDVGYLFPLLAAEYEIERCSLQMMRVAPPAGVRIVPAVLTGTSMLRYPAFAETAVGRELVQQLTEEFDETDPVLLSIGANVMFTQRPDGALLVGDSHRYGTTVDPFLDEATSEILLARVSSILEAGELEVLERWQGVYASSAKQPYVVVEPDPDVTVVCVTSGVGMTIAFGLARRVFDDFSVDEFE